jgi:ketosteroid isomerase-like protein
MGATQCLSSSAGSPRKPVARFGVEVHDILANDDHNVTLVTESATRNGKTFSGQAVHVSHMRDGKIAEYWDAEVDYSAPLEF